MRFALATLVVTAARAATVQLAHAEVVRYEITHRRDIAGGRSFGAAGPYELIEGRILFAVDPANRYNERIVDLGLAPRTGAGRVEAWADFAALRP